MEKIVEAVKVVHNGGVPIQPDVAKKVVGLFSKMVKDEIIVDERVAELTDRETDILGLLGDGKSNKEIAGEIYISSGTVKNHITSILSRLNLRDRTQLALFAVKNDIKFKKP